MVLRFQSTPARGGRRMLRNWKMAVRRCFNPRPHAAGDPFAQRDFQVLDMFQSTPARGGRHECVGLGAALQQVSIHARTRRAT